MAQNSFYSQSGYLNVTLIASRHEPYNIELIQYFYMKTYRWSRKFVHLLVGSSYQIPLVKYILRPKCKMSGTWTVLESPKDKGILDASRAITAVELGTRLWSLRALCHQYHNIAVPSAGCHVVLYSACKSVLPYTGDWGVLDTSLNMYFLLWYSWARWGSPAVSGMWCGTLLHRYTSCCCVIDLTHNLTPSPVPVLNRTASLISLCSPSCKWQCRHKLTLKCQTQPEGLGFFLRESCS